MQSQLDLRDLLPGCWPLAVRLRGRIGGRPAHPGRPLGGAVGGPDGHPPAAAQLSGGCVEPARRRQRLRVHGQKPGLDHRRALASSPAGADGALSGVTRRYPASRASRVSVSSISM